jgi:hypothetical protein
MEGLPCFSDVRLAGVALLSKRAQGGTGKRIEGVKRGVQGPTGHARRCCFLALSLALCGCALSESFEVGPFLREQITGDTWRACAAREYQFYARARVRGDRDWTEASVWAAKGRAALASANSHAGADACACGRVHALSDMLASKGDDALQVRLDEARAACTTSR